MSPISRIISSKVDNFSIDFQRMDMSYNLILMLKMISKEGNFQDNFLGGNKFFHSLLQSFVYNSFNFKLCFKISCLIFSKRGETIKFKFIFQLFILIRFYSDPIYRLLSFLDFIRRGKFLRFFSIVRKIFHFS